ncbi:hypothetical protein BDN72DRAFT_281062 [Pluteus cervinus]|uniref:Uncharacterized protein n=1 Tax=Pluteus cervinus TaxID=181527 RepID=A0ACD3AEX3_9AGAR|nr:hypothetical protein BDN72DRAFT_281062 [Pluteus cervinus]
MDSEGVVVELARDKIDAEIATLEERIRILRTERNRLSLISRCPPEVMTQIFAWIQQFYLGSRFYSDRQLPYDYRRWTRVTRVSQGWRHIALSSKALWNIIPMQWLAYATESFSRLGSMPFFLFGADSSTYSYITNQKPELWNTIATECHRIRFIRRVVDPTTAKFPQPMPLLEYVEVTSARELPPSFFSPALQTLILSFCKIDWNWPVLPQLTTLEIKTPAPSVSLDSFVNLLQNCPSLQTLKIHRIFPETPEFRPEKFQPAQPSPLLPRLSSFHASAASWEDGHSLSLGLLSHLRFTAPFTIHIEGVRTLPGSLSSLMQVFNRILSESSTTIRRVFFVHRPGTTEKSYYQGAVELALHDKSTDLPFIQLSMSIKGQNDLSDWIKDIAILPLDQVEHLSTDLVNNPAAWKENGIGQLSKLRSINVFEGGQAFLKHIADDYEDFKASRGHGGLSFAALEEVETKEVQLNRELKHPLCVALAGREKAGYRFKKLMLEGKVTDDSMKQLQKYVDEVELTVVRKRRRRGQ